MGKLTSLLKKKKSKGDDLSGQRTGSTMSGSSVSVETSGISAPFVTSVPVVAPLSLSIPTTTEMITTTATELQSPFSLMDDIMDELAGTTPDTPQPSKANDLSDFGLAFQLSRQLDLGASDARPAGRGGVQGHGAHKIGKLEQNSVFKDNAFLQQARSSTGASMTPTPPVSGGAGGASYRSTLNHNSTTTTGATVTVAANRATAKDTPTYLQGRFQTKEAEEEEHMAQAAAAKLREASKKANAQLPSDDEGSDVSSDDSEDESGLSKKQRRLLAQQQHQHQLFLQQQQILQQQLAGVKGAGVDGVDGEGEDEEEEEKKPVVINHEAVIDRMKDRHRALLQGAHAAHAAVAREEYYEDYRDDYAMMQQQQGMLSPGGGPMAYTMQYGGMDPSMMYADDYRLQQQQQQLYFQQGAHPHVNSAAYNHPSMNGMNPGYGYAHPPASMPSYTSGMQTPVYHQQNQYFSSGAPIMSHHIMHQQLQQQQQQFQQGRSNSMASDGSVPNSSSRRGSVQHSVVSSARVSEDSWNDAAQQHSNSVLSTQKTANSDSGYSGAASDQGKNTSFDDSLEDIQTTVGSEYKKTSTTNTTTKSKLDDVTKVIEVLSISQVAADKDSDGDDEESQSSDSDSDSDGDDKSGDSDSDSDQDEDPESLKGSTVIESIRHGGFKGTATTGSSSSPSAAASNNGSHDHDDENDSSDDDDQPIILSRRNSARGGFLPASAGIKVSAEEAVMMSGTQIMMPSQQVPVPTSNGQMQYLPPMSIYQQQPMHMSYMPPQSQQQPQQQILSPQQQHAQPQQQQQYMPMGYQFSGSGPQPQGPIGHSLHQHQHSYSVDRVMPPSSMIAQGPVARRVAPTKGHTSTGSSGSAIQSQYPIPATTLLHPGPRRSQSARVRPQATSPINSNNNPAIAAVAAASGAVGQAGRGRSSLDFVRLPSSGYQSLIGAPSDFNPPGNGTGPYIRGYAEPISPPSQPQQQQQPLPPHLLQHHQHMQQQMEKQQLQQQGYFMGGGGVSGMGGPQYGYMMQTGLGVGVGLGGDPYSAHPHQQQQILQAGRR